ncbi:MAG: cysteine desulfurase-like protein [Holophagales bacterium]|nr:MAG: cysteine desulfurase-like protein [Holophagales bacterium]
MTAPLDLSFVRSSFPALAGEWVYLDNAGGSQVPATVAEAVREYLLTANVQHGASYEPSRRAMAAVEAGQRAVATLAGTEDPAEILLGSSTTVLMQNLARAMVAGGWLAPGDEVIVTDCDHEANAGPWRRLAAHGVVVREWRLDRESLRLRAEDLAQLLSPRTRLVAFTHCSNVVGSIHDVAALAALAHQVGARVVVDGVAFAPHRLVDVVALGVDFYAFSLYKVYGPHLAALWGRRDHFLALGKLNHEFVGDDDVPYKLQPGGPCYELAAALPATLDYLVEVGRRAGAPGDAPPRAALAQAFAALAAHEESLAAPLLEFLRSRSDVRIVGDPSPERSQRAPTVSFVVAGRDSAEIVGRVDEHRIGIRFGHFYAKRLIDGLGLAPQNGVVRVSMVHYNTREEIERLIAALAVVLG